jgi:hypothetical protein
MIKNNSLSSFETEFRYYFEDSQIFFHHSAQSLVNYNGNRGIDHSAKEKKPTQHKKTYKICIKIDKQHSLLITIAIQGSNRILRVANI